MSSAWQHILLLNGLVLLATLSSGCQTPPPTNAGFDEIADADVEQSQLLDAAQIDSEIAIAGDQQTTDFASEPADTGPIRDNTQTEQGSSAANGSITNNVVGADPTTQNSNGPNNSSPTTDSVSASSIRRPQTTGNLTGTKLTEVSGLAASLRDPDLLWVINDSGNAAQLHAVSRNGDSRGGSWLINAENRDWEDLATAMINGEPYLFIGDIGDNQRSHDEYLILVVREPELNGRPSNQDSATTLEPAWTIRFRYEDGAHNAEAMAVVDEQLILLTKEPISNEQTTPAGIYSLPLGPLLATGTMAGTETALHIAVQAGTMQVRSSSLEGRLAVAFADVDLNHITALSIDHKRNVAWLLTYRNILRFERHANQGWVQALTGRGLSAYRHSLEQAEALDVSSDGLVWFTTEGKAAPLWVLPANHGVASTN
ncbi:MAG: hypothetical protein V3U76_11505 [Granulosicoccus sp.]